MSSYVIWQRNYYFYYCWFNLQLLALMYDWRVLFNKVYDRPNGINLCNNVGRNNIILFTILNALDFSKSSK